MQVEDRLALQDLVHRYAYFVDSFMFPEWVELFARDGVLDESEFGMGRYDGQQALAGYGDDMGERVLHLVHLMTNHLIWEMSEDRARGTSFAIVESMQKTGSRARYHVKYDDEYVRISGKWVFQARILRKSFPPEVISL
jgi:hypothetical protein